MNILNNKSIKSRILIPFLIIIISALILTLILFNIIIGAYIRNQAEDELMNTVKATERMLNKDNPSMRPFGENDNTSRFVSSIDFMLRPKSPFSQTRFILIDENFSLLFPVAEYHSREKDAIQNILPVLKSHKSSLESENTFTFTADNIKYLAASYPLKNMTQSGYIVYYTDISKSESMMNILNLVLFIILIATAVIAVITSLVVSGQISKPINTLCDYAKTIGERNFKPHNFESYGGEIEELANSMNMMAEKLSVYDKAQKTFLQNASHELRTPLMSIQGYAEGIKYGVFDDSTKAADTIIDESKRLTKLVEELLYLSRLDTIDDPYRHERLDLCAVTQECISRMQGLALKESKELTALVPETPIFIEGDGEKLSRAIINIISNCIRYAAKTVSVSLESRFIYAILIIKDDGAGFDEEDLKNIFTRFYKGKGGNFGLGLSISHSVIERHSGEIRARNGKNGAEFIIKLPMVK